VPRPTPRPSLRPASSTTPIDLLVADPQLPGPIDFIGNRTLKVFRVVGKEPTGNDPSSIATLERVLFLKRNKSVLQQFKKCSNDRFFWVDAGIENIILDKSISSFLTNEELQTYVLTFLRNKGRFSSKLEELADNVLLAVPQLTNTASVESERNFQGIGYKQRRLSMFSGKWSNDHSMVMQQVSFTIHQRMEQPNAQLTFSVAVFHIWQLGHNLGLVDAVGLVGGGDDSTTFMGAPPHTIVRRNGPRQCVNGYGACKFNISTGAY
jgi:hypothetical protein